MNFFLKQIKIINLILLFSALPLSGQDDFTSFMTVEDTPGLQWSGKGILNARYYADYSNILESKIDVYPEINLDLVFIGDRSEFHGKIEFSDYSSILPEQLIKEAYSRFYFNKFNIEAGYMKLIWGKGVKVFTFDNINAVDYTDFINPSYMDRKLAEVMIKINVPFGMQGMVEAVYTPVFTSDIYPGNGDENWFQNAYDLIDITDSSTFADNQLGLRFSNSIGGFDLGASYQYTFLRESLVDLAVSGLPLVSRDRIHLFGAETAFVAAAFNIWAEAAYYMTRDLAGDDPIVHNGRFLYLFGFSRDVMIHNISLSIQVKSELKLATDGIRDTSDIDYESDAEYSPYLLTAGLRDSFLNEKITGELSGTYSLEDKDFMITPELRINLVEDTWLNMKYTFFLGESNTLFGQFADNDFLEFRMEYSF